MQNNIKVERARLNLTQEELARQAGVSRQTIHSIETGKYIPSAILALKIARVFHQKAEDVFWLEETD